MTDGQVDDLPVNELKSLNCFGIFSNLDNAYYDDDDNELHIDTQAQAYFQRNIDVGGNIRLGIESSTTDTTTGIVTYTNSGGNILVKINGVTYTITPTILSHLRNISSDIQNQIDNITIPDLNSYAPKDSPTFTGTPISVTPDTTDNSTKIATTAFVKSQPRPIPPNLSNYALLESPTFTGEPLSVTPDTTDNSTKIATTEFVKAQGYLSSLSDLNIYALLESPTFTGAPLSVTPTTTDNSTKIATTEFVKAQGYITSTPDLTSYAPKNSPTFTGTPLSVTPATTDNSTKIATTEFVKTQGYITSTPDLSSYATTTYTQNLIKTYLFNPSSSSTFTANDPVLYFKFRGDSINYGSLTSVTASFSGNSPNPNGIIGGRTCLTISNAGDYVYFPAFGVSSTTTPPNNFSFGFWCNIPSSYGFETNSIGDKTFSSSSSIFQGDIDNGFSTFIGAPNFWSVAFVNFLNSLYGTWIHIFYTVSNATTFKLYLNGNLLSTNSNGGGSFKSLSNYYHILGRAGDTASRYFSGCGMTDFLYYDRTLSDNEIINIYNITLITTIYATPQYVNSQGFLTSSSLTGYATTQYVNNQSFLTSSSLTGYATTQYVNSQGFLTSSSLTGYAPKDNPSFTTKITTPYILLSSPIYCELGGNNNTPNAFGEVSGYTYKNSTFTATYNATKTIFGFSGTTSVANLPTTVFYTDGNFRNYTTSGYDTSVYGWRNSTGNWICPQTGKYQICVSFYITSNNSGNKFSLNRYDNSNTLLFTQYCLVEEITTDTTRIFTTILPMNTGDYFNIILSSYSGNATMTFNGTQHSSMKIMLLG